MTSERPLARTPLDWVSGFALLLLCQLAGEVLVRLAGNIVPGLLFPGPVAGLLILLVLLAVLKHRAGAVISVGQALLGILTLLFVPSAVGIIEQGEVIQAWGVPLVIAVVVSTVLTLLVTVGAFIGTQSLLGRRKP